MYDKAFWQELHAALLKQQTEIADIQGLLIELQWSNAECIKSLEELMKEMTPGSEPVVPGAILRPSISQ